MTRSRYVRLLNLAIERGEAPQFREAFPSAENCPDSLYENVFPESAPDPEPEPVVEMTAEPEEN